METNALLVALNEFLAKLIDARVDERMAKLSEKVMEIGDQVLRIKNEGTVMTEAMVHRMISDAINSHTDDYDHDAFLTEMDDSYIENCFTDYVQNLNFEVRVS